MGRRPELKSVEFFEGIILAFEIFTILCLKPLKKCYTVWEHDPTLVNQPAVPAPHIPADVSDAKDPVSRRSGGAEIDVTVAMSPSPTSHHGRCTAGARLSRW